ncbi:hypothetical protein CRG98_019673 [Punica granatum]|uniref:Uncharacterized protein n=1 Tax=Punica granatum TaxID=22663 RepID=A0A2I0JVJ1_PUNGR|nr:hypothetical protein CRG98_019673 [Punica granatum]
MPMMRTIIASNFQCFMFGVVRDTGNNYDIKTVAKCKFHPYGRDFIGGETYGEVLQWESPLRFLRCEEDRSDEYAAGRIRAGTEDNRWKLEVGVLRASKPSGSALQLFSSSALQLSAKLKDHSAQIPGVRFVYMDIYSTFLDIIRNYTKYAMSSLRGVPLLCNQSH